MRELVVICAAILLLGSSAVPQSGSDKTPDEQAIRQIMLNFEEAFTRKDARQWVKYMADDVTYYNAYGHKMANKEEMLKLYEWLFSSGIWDESDFKITAMEIRFLRADTAIVDRFGTLTAQKDEKGRTLPDRKLHATSVMTKKGENWLIDYYSVSDLRVISSDN